MITTGQSLTNPGCLLPPAWLQKLGLAMGAPLGRLLGFKPAYQPAAPKAPTALGV